MSHNTFYEGVDPGGLIDRGDIKLLICYLLKTLDRQVSKTRMNEILQSRALANYFETNQAISELIRNRRLTSELVDGEEMISLVPEYRYEISTIEHMLPRSVREKAMSSALRLFARDRNESENEIKIEKCERGFNVTFIINDKNVQLMSLTVFVADEEQAYIVKDNFLDDPAGIYSMIIASLTVD